MSSLICGVLRFTPTGVGTTWVVWPGFWSRKVHPHGRGDNVRIDLDRRRPPRFTPTGVGTTRVFAPGFGGLQVHPHGRGDNWMEFLAPSRQPGSPPRAWGQQIGYFGYTS